MDQFLLFGDSLTQQSFSQERGFGLGAALSDAYVRRLDVVNREQGGYSGYNTRQALQIIEQVIPHPDTAKLRFLTVWFGANDSRLPNTPGTPQHIDLDEYICNLEAILTHARVRAHDGVKVIVLSPPPVDETLQFEHDRNRQPEVKSPRRTAKETERYARAARDVAARFNVDFVDVWTLLTVAAGGEPGQGRLVGKIEDGINPVLAKLLHDGLHFNPAGYKLVFDELMRLISEKYPDQMPEKLKYVLPAWDDPVWLA